jgi:hypothetical protein
MRVLKNDGANVCRGNVSAVRRLGGLSTHRDPLCADDEADLDTETGKCSPDFLVADDFGDRLAVVRLHLCRADL